MLSDIVNDIYNTLVNNVPGFNIYIYAAESPSLPFILIKPGTLQYSRGGMTTGSPVLTINTEIVCLVAQDADGIGPGILDVKYGSEIIAKYILQNVPYVVSAYIEEPEFTNDGEKAISKVVLGVNATVEV